MTAILMIAPRRLRLARLLGVGALVSGILLSPGCTSLRSSSEPVGGPSYHSDNKARVGLYYFLPKALLTIQCVKAPDSSFTITVSRNMSADQRHRYFLRWTQNPFYDDAVSSANGITTDADGLLTNVDISATDQTPAIVDDISKSVVNVFKILGGGAQDGKIADAPKKGAHKALDSFKYMFDPLDRAETAEVVRALKEFGIVVDVCPASRYTQSCIGEELSAADAKADATEAADPYQDHPRSGGVYFHPPTTVEMRFDFRLANADVIHRQTVMVPDPTRVACFRFGRSPLVQRDTTLTLSQGMPSAFKISRKSVIKGATGIISSVTQTVADAIPTIINVKTNSQVSDLKAKDDLLTERKKVLDDQQALIAAQKAAAATPTPPGGAGGQAGDLDKKETPGTMTGADGHHAGGSQSGRVPGRSRQTVHFEGDVALPEQDPPDPNAAPAAPSVTPTPTPTASPSHTR